MKNYVIDLLIDKLYNYEDCATYSTDLAHLLLDVEIADGCIEPSINEAKKWLYDNKDDIYNVLETIMFNYGIDEVGNLAMDIFGNPCKGMLSLVLEMAREILDDLDYIQDNWDTEITLDKKTIEIIKKELEEQKGSK